MIESAKTKESVIEHTTLDWFQSLGWKTAFGPDISFDGLDCERENYDQVVRTRRFHGVFKNTNPNIPIDNLSF
jgi:type I restriction enzyme R subunit